MNVILGDGTIHWRILALLVILCLGCGGEKKTFEVTGTVTYLGKPLTRGIVAFMPEQGRPLDPVHIDVNGGYKIEAPEDSYRVMVISMPELGTLEKGKTPEESVGPVRSLIPERYGNPATSGLTVKVEAGGQNKFDFTLRQQ